MLIQGGIGSGFGVIIVYWITTQINCKSNALCTTWEVMAYILVGVLPLTIGILVYWHLGKKLPDDKIGGP